MEYKPTNIVALVEFVKTLPAAEAAAMLQEYGNIRETKGFESGWQKCTQLHRKCLYLKRKQQREFTVEEKDGYVELHELNKLIFFVLDELQKTGHEELIDVISVKLSSVKIDRRLTFLQ